MNGNGDSAAHDALVEMAQGYFRGKVLCASVRLGLADALADGAKGVDELAVATAAPADTLVRLLRALASIGIIAEVSPARFALTPLGEPLRKDSSHSAWASVIFWADLLADAWTYLPDCVRAGGPAGAAAAMEREGVTSRWSREPEAVAIFHKVFAERGPEGNSHFAGAYDFSTSRVVADLGGAGGGLLAAILIANPPLRGMLVDRQQAVEGATKRFAAVGLLERCEFMAGDLLQAVPAGADVYIMRSVLHGYTDDAARRILQNCHAAMSPESRLLIIETVLPAQIENADPRIEKLLMSDLNMLAVTGGRERSLTEWESLLSSAQFERRRRIPIPGETSFIIEFVPQPTAG